MFILYSSNFWVKLLIDSIPYLIVVSLLIKALIILLKDLYKSVKNRIKTVMMSFLESYNDNSTHLYIRIILVIFAIPNLFINASNAVRDIALYLLHKNPTDLSQISTIISLIDGVFTIVFITGLTILLSNNSSKNIKKLGDLLCCLLIV